MTLAELIDIEIQMLKDHDADPIELRQRDRDIGRQLSLPISRRRELFLAWLQRVRTSEHPSPGELFETGYRWLGRILLVAGLLAGGGSAASVLSYDGSKPVNIVYFLALLIGIQIITMLFFLLNALPRSVRRFMPGLGEFYNFIRELSYLFSRAMGKIFEHLPAKHLNGLWQDLQHLKVKQKLYGSVEKWLAIRLTQRFGLAFNIGALVTCLYLITFSDLAFAWNTTLEINNKSFHTIIRTIAAPWKSLAPKGVPSLELVEQSRYFQLDDEYIDSRTDAGLPKSLVVGRWWLFLILCLVVYGFIPRLIIYTFSNLKFKTALQRLPLKSAEFESLFDRLTRPLVQTRAIERDTLVTSNQFDSNFNRGIQTSSDSCLVIKWGDLAMNDEQVFQLIKKRLGCSINRLFSAGGLNYRESNLLTLESIGKQKMSVPILILVESWESPDAAILNFMKQLRNIIANTEHIIIGLVNTETGHPWQPPNKTEWQVWKNGMARLADPYLRIEAMVEN
ncbi:MAG: DUF2868 domain-containing protein [bacterium]|nr:DUF2868 domain-containing protein [bacterium]